MNKLIPLALVAAGTATASSAGIYVSNRNSSYKSKDNQLIFEDIDALKAVTDVSKYDCFKDHFQGLNIQEKEKSAAEFSSTAPAANTFFKTAEDSTSFRSCLLVNHRKTTHSNSKWTGKITWLWTFVKGDEGFINFNVAETSTSEPQKLTVSGLFYLLQKEGESWTIKHKKEVTTGASKKIEADKLDTNFPKAHTNLATDAGGSFWGFMDETKKLQDVCGATDCTSAITTPTYETKKLSWTGSSTGSAPLSQWCEKMDWWSNAFSLSNWDLKTKIASFNGTWTKSTPT